VPALRRNIPGSYYRRRDPQRVADEMEHHYTRYQHLGIESFAFCDACFGHDIQHLTYLVEALVKKGFPYRLPLVCQTHPAMITKEWVRLVKTIGCAHVSIGIESGDERIRCQAHNKKITNEQIKEFVKILREADLLFSFYMIMDAPGENWLTALRTLKMMVQVHPLNPFLSFFLPLPEAPVVEKYNLTIPFQGNEGFSLAYNSFRTRPLFLVYMVIFYKIMVFACRGIYLRGFTFIIDIVKYGFNVKGMRNYPFFSKAAFPELYRQTVMEYTIYDSCSERNKYNMIKKRV
jgi:radical SAM superfamily enzyme YgiQ (UPF0313 family)